MRRHDLKELGETLDEGEGPDSSSFCVADIGRQVERAIEAGREAPRRSSSRRTTRDRARREGEA